MSDTFQQLGELIQTEMARLHVPGVALGIVHGDEERTAGFGVTNVEHPLPVDGDTLFQIGSITKTVTATIAMQLVEEGRLALDAAVREYLPELRLADEETAARVTVRHLFTHTAGWAGDYFDDVGPGDDALAKIVARLVKLPQVTPLGQYWSYNNAAFYLAGRILEVTTGKPYETLAKDRVFDPLGMDRTFFFPADCITYRVAAGHEAVYDESNGPSKTALPKIARPWAPPRALAPVGGAVSTARDLLRYARFHMGDGTAAGRRLLSPESLALMQTPYARAANGEQIGLAWFIKDLARSDSDGEIVRIIRHGGATNGQMATLQMAPARGFAAVFLTNSDRGDELYGPAMKWVYRHYLSAEEREPAPLAVSPGGLAEYEGRYTALLSEVVVRAEGQRLVLQSIPKGGFPKPDSPPSPTPPPFEASLCEGDTLVVVSELARGERGEFLRDAEGAVAWLRMGGRLCARQRGDPQVTH